MCFTVFLGFSPRGDRGGGGGRGGFGGGRGGSPRGNQSAFSIYLTAGFLPCDV